MSQDAGVVGTMGGYSGVEFGGTPPQLYLHTSASCGDKLHR